MTPCPRPEAEVRTRWAASPRPPAPRGAWRTARAALGGLCAAVFAAGCGDGGSSQGSYFAVQGTQSAGGLTFTACIDGIEYVEPSSTRGRQLALNLASYYGLVGSYRAFAGEGTGCRAQFPSLSVLLSVSDYNNTVLPAVGGSPSPSPSPPPPSPPPPSPPPAPAPITPRSCGSTQGSGTDGLSLHGSSSYSGLSGLANQSGTVTLDPGEVAYSNPALTSSSRTGTLRSTLWAVSGSFNGGGISGRVVARYNIRFTDGTDYLRNGESANLPPNVLAATTPSRGSYCMVVTLEQYAPSACPGSGDGFCLVDWTQFPNAAQFE